MDSFLFQVAKYIKHKHKSDFDHIALVFPNRRAGLFFRKYFAEQFDRPVWSPHIFTVPELMQKLSTDQIPDQFQLIFDLYESYIEVSKKQEAFDEFYFWGMMVLNDFDKLDKQLVNPKELFTNLSDLKQIDFIFDYLSKEQKQYIEQFWGSLKNQGQFKYQEEFVLMWKILFPLYENFQNRLKQKGLAYEGMLYRNVAENFTGLSSKEFPFPSIYFIGLNALNKCEIELLKVLQKRKLAGFFWDYDHFYLDKDYHEAGRFLRENLELFPMPEDFPLSKQKTSPTGQTSLFEASSQGGIEKNDFFRNLENPKKKIFFYPVNSQTMQAKTAYSILETLEAGHDQAPDRNALILPDEKLLFPMLYSLPEKFSHVNITMGYPATNSSAFNFIENLIDLQKSKRQSGQRATFYHKQVLNILDHPFFAVFESQATKLLKDDIVTRNLVFIDADIFSEEEETVRRIFSTILNTPEELIVYLKFCLYELSARLDQLPGKNQSVNLIEKEIIHELYLSLSRLEALLKERKIEIGLNTFIRFFRQAAQQINLPFSGEPLKGLQIMGVLETRALDFNTIVIPSMNEGVFPKNKGNISFIPYNLRKGFDMPVSDHQDAISAYYFYRMIQRAENVHLIYNTQNTDFGKSEMSRYLYQLKFNSDINIVTKQSSLELQLDRQEKIEIAKDEAVWADLSKFLSQNEDSAYVSPSALNDYLICSLRFYFKYVARLKAPKEISEEVDALIFGNILHDTIEQLYRPYVGRIISDQEFEIILKDDKKQREVLKQSFAKEFFKSLKPGQDIQISGKNSLAFEVLRKYLKQIIKVDQQQAPLQIVDLEMKVKHSVRLNETGASVNLGGLIDRVDRLNKTIRIVDYKTGADKKNLKSPEILYQKGNRKEFKAIFQLFVYAYLYKESQGVNEDIYLALYLTKELFNKEYSAGITLDNKEELSYNRLKEEFEPELMELLEEIFNRDIPFSQVEDSKVCENCDFKDICRRV